MTGVFMLLIIIIVSLAFGVSIGIATGELMSRTSQPDNPPLPSPYFNSSSLSYQDKQISKLERRVRETATEIAKNKNCNLIDKTIIDAALLHVLSEKLKELNNKPPPV